MATIQDIVTGALRKIVLHGNETPSADDSSFALDELNDMMKAFNGQQVFINWETMTLTGTFPLEEKHEAGVKAMLAVRISPAFGGDALITRELAKQADDGYSMIWGDYHRPDDLAVDEGLTSMPGRWYSGVDNVNV